MARRLPTLPHTALKGKRVLLRLDVNVPLEKTARGTLRVADDTRIREALPAIIRLQQAGARIIIAAHLGEPKGKIIAALRMHPLAASLAAHLQENGHLLRGVTHWNFPKLRTEVASLHPGEILMLENLRFEKGEEKNDPVFAKELASLADIYVNEAFSVSHRAHASVSAICNFLPHYAGWHLAEEASVLERVRTKAKKPLVLVIGGAKVHDKISMMVALAPKTSTILVGGIAANTILKMQRLSVGRSKTDDKPPTKELKKLLAEKRHVPGFKEPQSLIQLPVDVTVATNPKARARVVSYDKKERVEKGEIIYDIGPASMRRFSTFLKGARTIIWNGPLGLIEVPRFAHGSLALARLIAARSRGPAFGVVGGGESLEVLDQTHVAGDVDFCSTGGGAMLEFLAGKKLPGIEALLKKGYTKQTK